MYFSFVRHLIEDIDFALEHMSKRHDVEEWILLRDTLRLSEDALHYDLESLPSQVLGRVDKVYILMKFSYFKIYF